MSPWRRPSGRACVSGGVLTGPTPFLGQGSTYLVLIRHLSAEGCSIGSYSSVFPDRARLVANSQATTENLAVTLAGWQNATAGPTAFRLRHVPRPSSQAGLIIIAAASTTCHLPTPHIHTTPPKMSGPVSIASVSQWDSILSSHTAVIADCTRPPPINPLPCD